MLKVWTMSSDIEHGSAGRGGVAPAPKILVVFGTRPEAIKLAPVIEALRRHPRRPEVRVCVTGQHRYMLDQVLQLFGIDPDYDLNVMQTNQTLAQLTASVLTHLDPVLTTEQPDWVIVQGDTTTVMSAALAAFYRGVRVAHVEAGLRTFDKHQPFPEEINRRVASVISDLHFAPTEQARQNLLREGVPDARIVVTGNPVIDALHRAVAMPCDLQQGALAQVPWGERRVILVTAHRRENFGRGIEQICLALRELAARYFGDVHIVYPVHLNPNVEQPVRRLIGDVSNITLTPPLDYLQLAHVMQRATLVLTDSGGIQEEAPGLGKPVLALRETTERPEAVEAGTVKLVGTDRARIVTETARLLDDADAYAAMARAVNPYGDGRAAPRIADALLNCPL